jgi:uncharacterized protein
MIAIGWGKRFCSGYRRSATAWQIDREVGDLSDDLIAGIELISYLRYTLKFDPTWLSDTLGIRRAIAQTSETSAMDNPASVTELDELAREAPVQQIKEDHFPKAFDI